MVDPADTAAAEAAYQQLESKRIELATQLTNKVDTGVLQKMEKYKQLQPQNESVRICR